MDPATELWSAPVLGIVASTASSIKSTPSYPITSNSSSPSKHGGSDDPSNLCLACERCNLFKGSDLTGFDSVTGLVDRLFNPREQSWADHFELQGPLIVGRTPTGRATVQVLSMNAGQRLQLRGALLAAGLYP